MGWVILALLALALLSRVALYIRLWAWKRSRKDPKERLEAEILWRNFRRKLADERLQTGLQRSEKPLLQGRKSRRAERRGGTGGR